MIPTSAYLLNAVHAAADHPWVITHRAQRDQHPQTQCRSITTRLSGAHEGRYVVDVFFEYWINAPAVTNDDIHVRVLVDPHTGTAQAVQWHLVHLGALMPGANVPSQVLP